MSQAPQETPDPRAAAQIAAAPVPTHSTLRRGSVPLQAVRFAVLNARIMRMVFKGDH